ncbi:PIN domain-containing protein [Candidatus Woesearchaeota archaeon]|nr:PIN domain-containing protein [Candidatus Woesearchaeota archaeon]
MTAYLDTSALAYLLIDNPPDVLRRALGRLSTDSVATSVLSYDELVWIARKRHGKLASYQAADFFLALDIEIVPLDVQLLTRSRALMEEHGLKPRDSIHAASALGKGIKLVVSEDKDFDSIKGLHRVTSAEFFA